MGNVYFELTRELNAHRVVAVLASGQAVVWHRLAIMSKDGDWVLREEAAACARVLEVLARHGATMRPSAPLDVRWLAGGWSSHFEFHDDRHRRVRCDFVTRPPRVENGEAVFATALGDDTLRVVDVPTLIKLKQTQRAKDYAVIGELARRLPPEEELRFTTDPDAVLALVGRGFSRSDRPAAAAARASGERDAVVVALAREVDALQQRDRVRVERYLAAAKEYFAAFRAGGLGDLPLAHAHAASIDLASRHLPFEA